VDTPLGDPYRGSMNATTSIAALDAIRQLTPAQIESRIADLDAERTVLSRLLRSIRAGERARQRTTRRTSAKEAAR
jgi:hypothetical protein